MKQLGAVCSVFLVACVAIALSCDRTGHKEGVYCDVDVDCAGGSTRCDTSLHLCIALVDGGLDSNEPDQTLLCAPATASVDCVDPAAPICGATGCRACAGAADDASCAARSASTPRCKPDGTMAGRCVACVPMAPVSDTSECGAATPICDVTGSCRACVVHAECGSGLCIHDGALAGRCAPVADVALVDNAGMTGAACMTARAARDGQTAATAYCEIAEAVAASRKYALVRGSAQPYAAIALTDQDLVVVGPGQAASPTARVFTVGVVEVNMTVNTGAHELVLEGLDLGGDAVMKAVRGATCTNNTGSPANARPTIRDTRIHDYSQEGVSATGATVTVSGATITGTGSGGAGVSATGGTVTLGRSLLQGNSGGVVLSSGVSYTVENNLIVKNLSAATPGVSIDGASTGVFRFNTVANNTTGAGRGGIECGAAGTKLIEASIVVGNTVLMGTQLGAQCTLDGVVTGSDSATAAIMKTPVFVGANDFHLVPSNAANLDCCVDRRVTGPTVDFDGSARPKGAAFDIGAHEVE